MENHLKSKKHKETEARMKEKYSLDSDTEEKIKNKHEEE